MKGKKIWIFISEGIYNGYGSVATGETREEAEKEFMKQWKEMVKQSNDKYAYSELKTYDEVSDYYSVNELHMEIGTEKTLNG